MSVSQLETATGKRRRRWPLVVAAWAGAAGLTAVAVWKVAAGAPAWLVAVHGGTAGGGLVMATLVVVMAVELRATDRLRAQERAEAER